MKKTSQAGIWMDHSNAIIMELKNDTLNETAIISDSLLHDEEFSSEKHEKKQHIKEQHQQSAYYNKLADIIRKYTDVVLFGPTDAKNELLNLLVANHLFSKIKIEVHNSDKMTKNKMHAFVKNYFR